MGKSKKKYLFKVAVKPNGHNVQSIYVRARHEKGAASIAREYDFEPMKELSGRLIVVKVNYEAKAINDKETGS